MKLTVNGKDHEHGSDGSITALLEECGADTGRVALMLNGSVVPRAAWPETILQENDRIELLMFAAGG